MEEKDIPKVKTLWERYSKRFKMYPEFTEDELRHNLISGRGRGDAMEGKRDGQVVWSYVVEVRRAVSSRSTSDLHFEVTSQADHR